MADATSTSDIDQNDPKTKKQKKQKSRSKRENKILHSGDEKKLTNADTAAHRFQPPENESTAGLKQQYDMEFPPLPPPARPDLMAKLSRQLAEERENKAQTLFGQLEMAAGQDEVREAREHADRFREELGHILRGAGMPPTDVARVVGGLSDLPRLIIQTFFDALEDIRARLPEELKQQLKHHIDIDKISEQVMVSVDSFHTYWEETSQQLNQLTKEAARWPEERHWRLEQVLNKIYREIVSQRLSPNILETIAEYVEGRLATDMALKMKPFLDDDFRSLKELNSLVNRQAETIKRQETALQTYAIARAEIDRLDADRAALKALVHEQSVRHAHEMSEMRNEIAQLKKQTRKHEPLDELRNGIKQVQQDLKDFKEEVDDEFALKSTTDLLIPMTVEHRDTLRAVKQRLSWLKKWAKVFRNHSPMPPDPED